MFAVWNEESAILLNPNLFDCVEGEDYVERMAEAGTTIWHEMQHFFDWLEGYKGIYGFEGEPYDRKGEDDKPIPANPGFKKAEDEFKKWWEDFWGWNETKQDITSLDSEEREKAEADAKKAVEGKNGHKIEPKKEWENDPPAPNGVKKGKWKTKLVHKRPHVRKKGRPKNADDKKHLGE